MLSSGSDIQILRRNGPGKTTLVSGDFRLATPLIGEEFYLLFFPDRIQRLWSIITGFIRNFSATLSLSITVFASFNSKSNSTA